MYPLEWEKQFIDAYFLNYFFLSRKIHLYIRYFITQN